MIKSFSILIILILLNSCKSSSTLIENDDLYFNRNSRTMFSNQLYMNRRYGLNSYYYPYYFYDRPTTIIIVPSKPVPNQTYGKRPNREGGSSPYIKRGRK